MTLLDLASRVEAATGPDRELDALIAPLQGLRVVDEGHPIGRMCYDSAGSSLPLPRYTASFDAAMTLVPEDHAVDLTVWPKRHRASVLPVYEDGDRWLHRGSDPHFTVHAATPALALTAAALRAQQEGLSHD